MADQRKNAENSSLVDFLSFCQLLINLLMLLADRGQIVGALVVLFADQQKNSESSGLADFLSFFVLTVHDVISKVVGNQL